MYSADALAGRQDWIERYAPLVRRIAHYMMARLPANVELGDVIQAGMIGLLDAVSRYEETQGAQFETYAAQRIRGAIVDELRHNDWLPRSLRKNMRRIETAIAALEQELGRIPRESEIAAHLRLTLAEYQKMLQDGRGYQLLYLEDFVNSGGDLPAERGLSQTPADVLDALLEEELRLRLTSAIADLPEREKLVMSLYYERELNLREIGDVMGVTESRVCQLHSQAVARLRAKLRAR